MSRSVPAPNPGVSTQKVLSKLRPSELWIQDQSRCVWGPPSEPRSFHFLTLWRTSQKVRVHSSLSTSQAPGVEHRRRLEASPSCEQGRGGGPLLPQPPKHDCSSRLCPPPTHSCSLLPRALRCPRLAGLGQLLEQAHTSPPDRGHHHPPACSGHRPQH